MCAGVSDTATGIVCACQVCGREGYAVFKTAICTARFFA
ncbi:hypothetical protein SALWKB2_0200 [Snodgrassella alvi wkB2]|nr:hypothetical protein SALWKB2_0200 [Snodgrassella alvi wkB2]